MPIPRGYRRAAATIGVACALWLPIGLLAFLSQNPFGRAVEAAIEIGGWSPDDVAFRGGTYGYRFFYSKVDAELAVATAQGERSVSIRLLHVPVAGWSVRGYSIR